jgi:hypothetical protein
MPPLTKAQKDKQRRQSRSAEDIRRYQDLQNEARRRASQRSQSSEQDLPMYHPDPAPNISSSSSSSSAVNNNEKLHDENYDNRSECDSPVKQRTRLGVTPEKGRPEIIQPP